MSINHLWSASKSGTSWRELTFVLLYVLYGFIVNTIGLLRTSTTSIAWIAVWSAFTIHSIGVVALWGYVTASIWRRRYDASYLGFTLGKGCWINVGLIVLSFVTFFHHLPLLPVNPHRWDPIQLLSIGVEELLSRALLIGCLMRLLEGRKGRFLLSVLISSLVFTFPHITTHTAENLFDNVFQMAVVFAVIYYFTGSILFPMFAHVMLNTGHRLGLAAGLTIIIFYFALAVLGHIRREKVLLAPAGDC